MSFPNRLIRFSTGSCTILNVSISKRGGAQPFTCQRPLNWPEKAYNQVLLPLRFRHSSTPNILPRCSPKSGAVESSGLFSMSVEKLIDLFCSSRQISFSALILADEVGSECTVAHLTQYPEQLCSSFFDVMICFSSLSAIFPGILFSRSCIVRVVTIQN